MNGNTDLTIIPGIGKNMAKHLANAGYPTIESLKGQDPDEVYLSIKSMTNPKPCMMVNGLVLKCVTIR